MPITSRNILAHEWIGLEITIKKSPDTKSHNHKNPKNGLLRAGRGERQTVVSPEPLFGGPSPIPHGHRRGHVPARGVPAEPRPLLGDEQHGKPGVATTVEGAEPGPPDRAERAMGDRHQLGDPAATPS